METKICKTCGQEKPLDEFSKTWRVRTKVPSHWCWHDSCKPCDSKRSYAHQRGEGAEVQKAYRESDAYKRSQKDGWLRLNYHKSLGWFEEQLAKQGGVCGICGKPEHRKTPKGQVKSLAVDHDHACCSGHRSCGNCVRGLICEECNHALGHVADKVEILESAISYLKQYKKV